MSSLNFPWWLLLINPKNSYRISNYNIKGLRRNSPYQSFIFLLRTRHFKRLWGQPLRSCSWMVTRAPLHGKPWGSTIYACADIIHVGKGTSGNARQNLISSSFIMYHFIFINVLNRKLCMFYFSALSSSRWFGKVWLPQYLIFFDTIFSLHWVINQGSTRLKQSTGQWSMYNFIISTFPSAIIQQPYILPVRGLYHSQYHIRQDWPGLKQKQPFQQFLATRCHRSGIKASHANSKFLCGTGPYLVVSRQRPACGVRGRSNVSVRQKSVQSVRSLPDRYPRKSHERTLFAAWGGYHLVFGRFPRDVWFIRVGRVAGDDDHLFLSEGYGDAMIAARHPTLSSMRVLMHLCSLNTCILEIHHTCWCLHIIFFLPSSKIDVFHSCNHLSSSVNCIWCRAQAVDLTAIMAPGQVEALVKEGLPALAGPWRGS